jgi:probable F420-dependent oxidoreductase
MTTLKLGVIAPYGDTTIASAGFLRDFAGTLEECGIDAVWTVEHVVVAEGYEPKYPYSDDGRMPSGGRVVPMPDPLELLAFFAALTSRVELGTAVVVAPLHSPAVLAKRAATLDRLSDGRFSLGLGIGWQREEYAAVGAPFAERGARLEECVAAMRALWADSPASYAGRFWSFHNVHSQPQPRSGAVRVVLGGNTDAAVTRAGRIADGWFPYTITPHDFARQAELVRETARAAGRAHPPVMTVWPGSCDPQREHDVDWVRGYVDAGATTLVVRLPVVTPEQLAGVPDFVARYRDSVLARV